MNNTIQIYNEPDIGRLFVVGDIHGCYDLLMAELNKLGFDVARDWLISVGDLVDRGPQCVQCVELLNQPWFKAVRGNHEQMCIDGFADIHYAEIHFKDSNGGRWFYQLPRDQRAGIVRQFEDLPLIIEITFKGRKYGFVHAQVDSGNNWEQFKQDVVLDTIDPRLGRTAGDLAVWGRARARAPLDAPDYAAVTHVDAVYMGHTVMPEATQKHNCFFIDTGAFMTGVLTVWELAG